VTKRHAFQQHQHVTLYLHTGTIIQSHLAMNANVRPVLLKSNVYMIWSARSCKSKSKDIWDYCLTWCACYDQLISKWQTHQPD